MVSHRTTAYFWWGVGAKRRLALKVGTVLDFRRFKGFLVGLKFFLLFGGGGGLNPVRPPPPVVICGELPMIHAYEILI